MSTTVLTVDDSRTMRDMLRLALADAGFRVVQAEDGVHGLEVLAGRDARRHHHRHQHAAHGRLRLHRGGARATRATARIADPGADHRERRREEGPRARDAGATGWIVKPFDPVKLVDAIRRVAA